MPNRKKVLIRLILFFLFLTGCFVYVGTKMYEIQIKRHDELFRKAQERYTDGDVLKKRHGEIYDRNGYLLIGNETVYTIAFDGKVIKDPEQRRTIAKLLAKKLPQNNPEHTYAALFRKVQSADYVDPETKEIKYRQYIVLAKNVEYELAMDIEREAQGLNIRRGLKFEDVNHRTYPKGNLLANILGFSSVQDNTTKPVYGLEKEYSDVMKAEDGKVIFERMRDGRKIGTLENRGGHDGNNVYLTVSEPLQAIVEEEIDRMYQEYHAKAAYAIMADPKTGDILAIAQRPTFDPNDRSTMKANAYRNRIAEDPFEPGSVMKPFVVAMALDRKFTTPEEKFKTGFNPWRYAGRTLSESSPYQYGAITPKQIIQHSSNIGTAMIAVRMGEQNLYNTLKQFQFGTRTDLPFKPESAGRLNPVKNWSKLSITRICIGHEITVTPLQLLRAYCMMANGGYPVQLRLVDAIESSEEGKKKMPYSIGKKSVFLNPNTHKTMIDILKTVPKHGGTAKDAAVPGFAVAGKTGTANKFVDGRYDKKKYYSSFCGFVPADNPRFVLVITCDEPQGENRYGGAVAGKTFSRIASRSLLYLGVHPDMTLEEWNADMEQSKKEQVKDRQRRERERLQSLKH